MLYIRALISFSINNKAQKIMLSELFNLCVNQEINKTSGISV